MAYKVHEVSMLLLLKDISFEKLVSLLDNVRSDDPLSPCEVPWKLQMIKVACGHSCMKW